MAAEMVLWKNLKRTLEGLNSPEVKFPLSLKQKLDRLRNLVRESERAVVSLENRDHIHDSLMRGRLEHFSTLLHEADDLLDQILTIDHRIRLYRGGGEVNRRENRSLLAPSVMKALSRSTQQVILFLSSFNQLVLTKVMAGRVEKISDDIGYLISQLANENNDLPTENRLPPIVWARPAENTVIGRENDMDSIVNLLVKPSKDSKSNVSVICMSGVAGVGKSALAKDIYQDDRVTSRFDLRMWIPATHVTDEIEIIREIVESCTNRRCNLQKSLVNQNDAKPFRDILGCRSSSKSTSLTTGTNRQIENNIYERRLRKELRGKLYLLVLDDAYLKKWKSLIDVLAGGAKGSQILVTTRLSEVADLVKREIAEVKAYPLPGLTKQHSLALLTTLTLKQHHHFGFSSEAEMKKTWSDIAYACKHVPLTMIVAERFLHSKTKDEWLIFYEELKLIMVDETRDVMEHVLNLSYSELPTQLRACFGYCSLFPVDFSFNKHDLISQWIAHGFVIPHDGTRSVEKAGEMYFMELARRCLFDQVSTDESGSILTCKMPHIVRNLALKFTAGVANIDMTDSCVIQVLDPAFKHVTVSYRGGSLVNFPSTLLNDPSLRTLIFIKEPNCDVNIDSLICNQLMSSYRRLRVLDLHDLGIKELPESIGDQIHLRYVDLSMNDGLNTLPKSITKLHNLQTLKVNSCSKLKTVAGDFGLLVNLIRFEVDECDSLTCMPLGLEKLTRLETLSRFVVGKDSSKQTASLGLRALGGLKMLRGRLSLELTGDWMTTNLPEANEALRTKENLVEVKISWPKRSFELEFSSENVISAHEAILENLKPNSNLRILYIEGYKGNDFPSWLNKEVVYSLPNLVTITIDGCGKCQFLPPFGELPFLRKLTIRQSDVQYMEVTNSIESPQETVQDRPLFQSLQELTLHNLYNLEGWRQEVSLIQQVKTQLFPCLSKLRIWNCPKLTFFPLFPKVINLNLQNTNSLLFEEWAKKASTMKNIYYIRRLQIKGCHELEGLEAVRNGLGGLLSLKHLVIENCDALILLAADVGKIPSLEILEISNCKNLDLSIDSTMTSGQRHATSNILSWPWENLKFVYDSNVRVVPKSPWEHLKYLCDLKLKQIPKMETLPDGLKHVTTLRKLWISSCQSLVSLPDWISSHNSLEHLRIESCHALKSLPEGLRNVRLVMKVEITECPELMPLYGEHKGEDWPKIKQTQGLLHKSRRRGSV